ncbi:MAG: hypothetical protein HYX93_01300 [Chloroflexi bacterium]|nr:hypothetical protein [Chloroflexota bacterium]
MTSLQDGFALWGYENREDVFIAPTIHAHQDFLSLERLDRQPTLKLALAESPIVFDPTGTLATLQQVVWEDLENDTRHRKLINVMLERNLAKWHNQVGMASFLSSPYLLTLEQVNLFFNSVLCALNKQTTTRRRRLVLLQQVAETLAVPEVYQLLLAIHGVTDIRPQDAHHLYQQALTIEAVLEKSLSNESIDLRALGLSGRHSVDWDREYLRRGIEDLLAEGHYQNAAFLAAHWADKMHTALTRGGCTTEDLANAYHHIMDHLGYREPAALAIKHGFIQNYAGILRSLTNN